MAIVHCGIVETGVADVPEVTFVRHWKIQNFDLIYPRDELLQNQELQLQTTQGPGEKCTWVVGLKNSVRGSIPCINMTFRLSEISGYDSYEFQANMTTGMTGVNGEQLYASLTRHLLKLDETSESFVCFTTDQSQSHRLSTALRPNRSVTFYIQISLPRHLRSGCIVPHLEKEMELLKTSSTNLLLNNLTKILGDEDSSDVKIITNDDVSLYAHKFVLKLQNPVFASMLTSDLSESRSDVVRVRDICGKTMEIILHYIYTGSLLPGWKDADTIFEFTYAAGKYQLTEVLKMLDNVLGSEYIDEYVCTYALLLNLANKLSLTSAEARLRKRIAEATARAKTTEELFAIYSALTEVDTNADSSNEGTTVVE